MTRLKCPLPSSPVLLLLFSAASMSGPGTPAGRAAARRFCTVLPPRCTRTSQRTPRQGLPRSHFCLTPPSRPSLERLHHGWQAGRPERAPLETRSDAPRRTGTDGQSAHRDHVEKKRPDTARQGRRVARIIMCVGHRRDARISVVETPARSVGDKTNLDWLTLTG